jgi:glutamyl-tRNA reductase
MPEFFSNSKTQWVFDLAIPSNTDPEVLKMENVMASGIDEISQVLVSTELMRTNEIPKAEAILLAYESDFHNWLDLQKHVPLINTMKDKLYGLGEPGTNTNTHQRSLHSRVNQTVGILAMNLRYKEEKGCHYINAINQFLQSTDVSE